MKKLIMLCVLLGVSISCYQARADKPIPPEELPATVKGFVNTHFDDAGIAYAKMDDDFLDRGYEVIFNDGRKVEFDRNGEWKSIECKYSEVPSGIIPGPISSYIERNWPNARIVEIERDRNYEVKLNNGFDLEFDRNYNLVDFDD